MFRKIIFNNLLYLIIIFAAICTDLYCSYLFNSASKSLNAIDASHENASLMNKKLTGEIANNSSLGIIEQKAKEMGFSKVIDKIIYLPKDNLVAQEEVKR